MSRIVYTGFHTIEENIRRMVEARDADTQKNLSEPQHTTLLYAQPTGPRVKKILALAKQAHVTCQEVPLSELDSLTAHLPSYAKDHRGVALVVTGVADNVSEVDFDAFIAASEARENSSQADELVLILDSITDPHNIGAIIRSACQFGASLVVLARNNALKNVLENDVVSRASAGAVSWVPVASVVNLVQAAQKLKKAGFWVYGADAAGDAASETRFAHKTALVLGSEGSGISRLLAKECDTSVSIPMYGKIDSLNVSVAAGILLYEVSRQRGFAFGAAPNV
jgi:23S rRNA (guanosine2251-2'-O)-methyltransferase